jgi:hypothetical protein
LAFDKQGRLTSHGKVINTRALGGEKERKVDKGALTSGRVWIGIFAALNTLPHLLIMGLILLVAKKAGDEGSGIPLIGVAISLWIYAVVAVILVSPWWISFGLTFHKTRPSMGFRMGLGVFWMSVLVPLALGINGLSNAHAPLFAYAVLSFMMMPFILITYLAHRSLTKSIASADAIRHNLTEVQA